MENLCFPVFEAGPDEIGKMMMSCVFMRMFFKIENMFRRHMADKPRKCLPLDRTF